MVARNAKHSISTILRKNRGLWTVYILSDSFLANCCCSLFFYFHWPKWLQCGGYHEKCEHAGVVAGLRAGSVRFVNRLKFERTLSLVLICRRCTCDMAVGSAWDTVPIWEHKWPATLVIPVFIAGMPAKLIRVQLRRHAGGKVLRWVLLSAAHVLIRPRSSPGGTGDYFQIHQQHMRTKLYLPPSQATSFHLQLRSK